MDLGFLSADSPEQLDAFLGLMRSCPLCVVFSDDFVGCCAVKMTANKDSLILDYQWPSDNWELFAMASDLFWTEQAVQEWAINHAHAQRGIHYQNIDCSRIDKVYPALDLHDACAISREVNEKGGSEYEIS